jgi:cytochrome b6
MEFANLPHDFAETLELVFVGITIMFRPWPSWLPSALVAEVICQMAVEAPAKPTLADKIYDKMFHNYVWKSIFRTGYPNTPRNQMLVVATNVFLHLHPTRIHRTHVKVTHTYCLGGLSFFMFLGLTVTGILLMFYYVPSVERAYLDMQNITTTVQFGQLMRNMHRWMAHAMVILVFLHMMRVFYTGAYKPPREFNWVVGVILLVLTFLLSFTGYLLPGTSWRSGPSPWATNIAGSAPVLGPKTRFWLLGGFEVGPESLIRFYTLHVIGLPLLAAIFMAVHFWRIRRDGGLARPALGREPNAGNGQHGNRSSRPTSRPPPGARPG